MPTKKHHLLILPFSGQVYLGLGVMLFLGLMVATAYLADYLRGRPAPQVRGDQTVSRESASFESHYPPKVMQEKIGFLPSWVVAQHANIYPEKLTQIIYFGLGVTQEGDIIQQKEDGSETAEWVYLASDEFRRVREEATKSGTKVLVAIKNFDNETIDNLTSNQTASNLLINQLLKVVEKFGLDGVNVDFEYVTDSNFPTVKYFNRFLARLAERLRAKDSSLILSVDVNATAVIKDKAYDLVKIGEVADQVILMAYDYHRPSSARAGPVAPIKGSEFEHSLSESLEALKGRLPSEKVVLGIPFYGYEWQTLSKLHKSQAVENTGALATYRRIQELLESREDIEVFWDEIAQSPWLTYEQSGAIKQIYYEDEKSLEAKLNFAQENRLGGIAIWSLGYEGDYLNLWNTIDKYSEDNSPNNQSL